MQSAITILRGRLLTSLILIFLTLPATAQINVHEGKRYLQTEKGQPFFWLADTDWELFHRLDREEIATVITTRSQQGFNILQCVVLAEEDGLRQPNRHGDKPFKSDNPLEWDTTHGNNPTDQAQYDYWDHIDYTIQLAAKKGLYIALLPTWGDKVAHLWGVGPIIFTAENAGPYGQMLAKRFGKYRNIIWVLGGDRPAIYTGKDNKKYDDRPIWRAMAAGIREAENGNRHFMTYHISGDITQTTSQQLANEDWIEMNTMQSGHGSRETKIWEFIARDLATKPTKPTADLEPCYEDHPVNPWDGKWTRARGYFSDYDVRVRMYRSVFAGACGVTYGHHQIWQFLDTSRYKPVNIGDTIIGWRKALRSPGAFQVRFLKELMMSRPYFSRIPDPLLVVNNGNDWTNYITATRDYEGSYAFIHLPEATPVTLNMALLKGNRKKAWWFNPANGRKTKALVSNHTENSTFTPPAGGRDWVLIVDAEL
ncbi:glycoside hydrolase family 140 protein [uncultured Chitinophaga sp.]|uniref:glycoside hydrolase family 140 protein n=1 Tax=uncultured Chitinophaga sp. TaxID=339340 RepID=UPI0025D1BCF1|nr:glycoside hydrolase family 140 protein [uncultured Chitinophaga sp.]